jgi:hypothetical protein
MTNTRDFKLYVFVFSSFADLKEFMKQTCEDTNLKRMYAEKNQRKLQASIFVEDHIIVKIYMFY